jgi:hypothetical protein
MHFSTYVLSHRKTIPPLIGLSDDGLLDGKIKYTEGEEQAQDCTNPFD